MFLFNGAITAAAGVWGCGLMMMIVMLADVYDILIGNGLGSTWKSILSYYCHSYN